MGEKDILSALFDEQDAKRSKDIIDSSDDINKDDVPASDSQSDSDNNQEEIESQTEEQMGESEDEETVSDAKAEDNPDEEKKEETQNPLRKKLIGLGVIILLIIAALIGIFRTKHTGPSGVKDGFITVDGQSSKLVSGLFYLTEKQDVMVNLTKLDGLVNIDVIRTDDTYRLSTVRNQITLTYGSSDVYLNSVKFTDDNAYIAPVSVNGYVYGDMKEIMNLFGYTLKIKMNGDESVVEAIVGKNTKFNDSDYTELKPILPVTVEEEETETEKQIEDQLVAPTDEMNIEETGDLPLVVPEATEAAPVETTEAAADAEGETKDTWQEKKENRWVETKNVLSGYFKDATPAFRQEAYADITDNVFCFNRASLGTYGNTITVSHDTPDGYFLIVWICADWSDQAKNVVSEESKAYYSGLEELYKKTIIEVLGENEGTSFFTYLKEHADKMMEGGGYIGAYGEHGEITTQWTDEPIGDGLQASTLDLSNWCGRYTDDGFEYSIVRDGNGLKIYLFN